MVENQIEGGYKDNQLEILNKQIEDMIKNSQGDEVKEGTLNSVSLKDLDDYLERAYIDIQSPRITPVKIEKPGVFAMLRDYSDIGIDDGYNPRTFQQRIYFIKSSDNALVLVPIQLLNRDIDYRLELLKNAPDFITEIYADLETSNTVEKNKKDTKKFLEEHRVRFDNFGNRI